MSSHQWTIFTLLGFYGWVLSTVAFILKSFSANGGFLPTMALRLGGGVIFFYCIWIIGMLKA